MRSPVLPAGPRTACSASAMAHRCHRRLRLLLLGALLCGLGLLLSSQAQASNPNIPQGLSGSVPYSVVSGSVNGWSILLGSNTIATAAAPNGWNVVGPPSQLTVSVPFSATVATNYQVNWSSNPHAPTHDTGNFNVISNGGGVLSLSLNVNAILGGNTCTGTITLTNPAPTGGATVTLSSSNTSLATVPASITIAAGATMGAFTVTTPHVSSSQDVTLSASYSSATAYALPLLVMPIGLTLTTAGLNEGFGLTLFANDGSTGSNESPFGVCPYGASVLMSERQTSNVKVFAADVDGQDADVLPVAQVYQGNAGMTVLNDKIYFAYSTKVAQLNPNGTLNQVIVTVPTNAVGIMADPIHNCLWVTDGSAWHSLYKVDPVAKTATVWLTGLGGPDGVALSSDGKTLYQVYNVKLTDQVANTSGSYTLTDTPEQGWPVLGDRNILSFVNFPVGNPAIAQGRALDISLPWSDAPTNGTWDIVSQGAVIGSSVNSNGWDVEVDHSGLGGAWVTVPSSAAVGVGYEVRLGNQGAGFFDVIASGSSTTAPVMLP